MSKYDFGYELEQGSTNEWAFQRIVRKSAVLELGASVGNLTRHLVQEKECRVDIIEIDADAGSRAAQFADFALTGEKADLNKETWVEYLRENRRMYDYIVILDVLEHLYNPEHTLKLAKSLLKQTGRMVVSIPNVAHNSVLIHMLQNTFEYTPLGLLDCTHIHFFAYEDIRKMLERLQLNIYEMDAIVKAVGTNEIVNSYDRLPVDMEYFLRTRKHAEVYQYLIVSGLESKQMVDRIRSGISEKFLYESVVLVNGLGKNEVVMRSTLEFVKIKFGLQNYGHVHDIRFFPAKHRCIVRKLAAYGQLGNQMVRINPNWTSGIWIDDEDIVLTEQKGEINFSISEQYDTFSISCSCILLDEVTAELFESCKEKLRYENEQWKIKLETVNKQFECANQVLQENRQQAEAVSRNLEEINNKLELDNKTLCKDKEELAMRIARLEAEVAEYRKLWYVRWKEKMHHHTEEKQDSC